MDLINTNVRLRRLSVADKQVIARLCNNKNIWDNLRDSFPIPYSEKDAEEFIKLCMDENPAATFGINYKGDFAGVVGLVKQKDVYRLTAELGYWIGEPFWGLGIATKAVNLIVQYGFDTLGLMRIYSGVFEYNKASQRVLEKAGFNLDCILEKAVIKNGIICDEFRYSILKK